MQLSFEHELSAEEQVVVERTVAILSGKSAEAITDQDRAGMRAFLQRAETRLSTYQRVAGVFLNGAGLLVLLPGLARDSISSTLLFSFGSIPQAKLLLAPWLFATIIPLFAFILLLRDLVQFYFSPRFLEIDPIKITRFSLAGITLPYDEGTEAKAQVIALKAKIRPTESSC